jgi:hypothetical protein
MGPAQDSGAIETGVARLAALGCSVEEIALTFGVSCAAVAEAFLALSDTPARTSGRPGSTAIPGKPPGLAERRSRHG